VEYEFGPASRRQDDVEPGETTTFELEDTVAYPGTVRRVWVHVPAGVADSGRQDGAAVTVFQDGGLYLEPDGPVRAGVVLDNLVAKGNIPPMVGVFVDPGVFPSADEGAPRKNRNAEYDAFDGRYAGFLADEVLPRVAERIPLSQDPNRRAICGGSSGGNAAFTAAWTRPDVFGRAIGFLSSFAQMPGGNPYPALLATEPRRPMRVFLAAGHRDLGFDRPEMNWLAENLRTAAALAEAGYDHRFVLGDGGHSPNHGGVILPDALAWVWREEA
jgi:enterochelin esterase family protein